MGLSDRLRRVESRVRAEKPHPWLRVLWWPGQRLADALRGTKPTDRLIVRRIVEAKDGKPVPDPVHDADRVLLVERMQIDG